MLGFASHSPGGLGVFDAAMLIALWEFDTEELLAGLLLFRLLYYIMPFALALAILGIRETRAALPESGAMPATPMTAAPRRGLDRPADAGCCGAREDDRGTPRWRPAAPSSDPAPQARRPDASSLLDRR